MFSDIETEHLVIAGATLIYLPILYAMLRDGRRSFHLVVLALGLFRIIREESDRSDWLVETVDRAELFYGESRVRHWYPDVVAAMAEIEYLLSVNHLMVAALWNKGDERVRFRELLKDMKSRRSPFVSMRGEPRRLLDAMAAHVDSHDERAMVALKQLGGYAKDVERRLEWQRKWNFIFAVTAGVSLLVGLATFALQVGWAALPDGDPGHAGGNGPDGEGSGAVQ